MILLNFRARMPFERLLNGSENGIEFRMAQIAGKYDLHSDEARIAYCGEVSELLASLPGAVEREIYTARAAEAAGITKDAMALEVKQAFRRRASKEKRAGASQGFESGCLASAERAQNPL